MNKYLTLFLKLVASIILLQTLFFKFSGAEESIALFTKIAGENEAFMRIGTGCLELITSILIFIPSISFMGYLLGIGLMGGAIFSHLTIIGIVSAGDGGQLFIYALVAFICYLILAVSERKKIICYISKIIGKKCKCC